MKIKDYKNKIDDIINSDHPAVTAGKFILIFLALGPLLLVGAAAPNAFRVFNRFKREDKYSRKQIDDALKNLKRRKLIEILEESGDKFKVALTNKGKKRVKEFSFELLTIKKPKKWDGKWRLLIFDIPAKPAVYNRARNAIRDKVKELGFIQLQKSAEKISFSNRQYNFWQ